MATRHWRALKRGKKMEYTIKGKLSFTDYKDFLLASLFYKKHRLIILILCFAFIIYNFVSKVLKAQDLLTAIIEVLALLILIFIYFIIYKVFTKRSYKTDSVMQKEMSYTFSEEGIYWSTDRGSYNYRIEDFRRFFFSKKVIAIYISNRKAIVIPRHFFETKEQEEKIEKFIKEKYMIENKK
jgi:amino acid permease